MRTTLIALTAALVVLVLNFDIVPPASRRNGEPWVAEPAVVATQKLLSPPPARLTGADLRKVDFSKANLTGADLRGARVQGNSLLGLCMVGAVLDSADLRAVRFGPGPRHKDEEGKAGRPWLDGADLFRASLIGADLSDADLRRVSLREARLRSAILQRAELTQADAQDADFDGADLTEADLSGTDLRGADLSGVTWRGANFSGTYLHGAQLSPELAQYAAGSGARFGSDELPQWLQPRPLDAVFWWGDRTLCRRGP